MSLIANGILPSKAQALFASAADTSASARPLTPQPSPSCWLLRPSVLAGPGQRVSASPSVSGSASWLAAATMAGRTWSISGRNHTR